LRPVPQSFQLIDVATWLRSLRPIRSEKVAKVMAKKIVRAGREAGFWSWQKEAWVAEAQQ
jgi:hypothetical protein